MLEEQPLSANSGMRQSDTATCESQWSNGWRVGDQLDAKDTAHVCYKATVRDVREESLYIHFNNWPSKRDEWIPASPNRLARYATMTGTATRAMIGSATASSHSSSSASNTQLAGTAWSCGWSVDDKLDALYDGKWQEARVVQVDNGRLFIESCVSADRWTEWLSARSGRILKHGTVTRNVHMPVSADNEHSDGGETQKQCSCTARTDAQYHRRCDTSLRCHMFTKTVIICCLML